MNAFLSALNDVVVAIDNALADYAITILLIACGLFFTLRTHFVQIRCFGEGWKRMFGNFSMNGKKADKSGMSSFQALATAIAAQVGTGNIVGACGAILIGGPGAIFWMWIIAFLGMATIYAEATLAQKTKKTDASGEVVGGPVYYIKEAFKGKFGKVLAIFFSVAAILALGLMGAMVQSNSIGESMNRAFGIPAWVVGLMITLLAALVFFGGSKRLASVTEKMVPIMAFIYIIGSLIIT
ncbi:MAG: alanine/glycine:cation symporter family protein, partial [Eubacteriales bacterium]